MKLIDASSGDALNVGDELFTFRGEKGVLVASVEPHKPNSTGRVIVRLKGSAADGSYFPNVFGAKWIDG